jgi:sulfoxide reductase catalytic subunit YedY
MVLSIPIARSLHFLVMVWFLAFITMHVALAAATGFRRNLKHMYAGQDGNSWIGFWIFAATMVIVVCAWVVASPFTLKHPRMVQRVGFALVALGQRLFEHIDSSPGEYSEADISPYFWHNGKYPDSPEYQAMLDNGFADYRVRVSGLVEQLAEFDIAALRAMSQYEQITQHFCVKDWSGVAKWGGVSMQTIPDQVRPTPEAKWVVSYALGDDPDAHPIEKVSYQLTMLAYDRNDHPLSFGHGAPLRLRNETQLDFKQVKGLKGIGFVADFDNIGGGYGGYNEDHAFFGYRQSI